MKCGCGCFEVVVDSDRFATTTFSVLEWNLLCVIKLRLEQVPTMMFVFRGLFLLMQAVWALFGSVR